MFFMALCVSRFHSFARIKFCGREEVGFDAFDGGFYGRIEGGLVGEGTGAVFFVLRDWSSERARNKARIVVPWNQSLVLKSRGAPMKSLG